MSLKIQPHQFQIPLKFPTPKQHPSQSSLIHFNPLSSSCSLRLRISCSSSPNDLRNRFKTACVGSNTSHGVFEEEKIQVLSESNQNGKASSVEEEEEEEEKVEVVSRGREEFGANQSILKQMKEILMFSGPATGLWICTPLMSLIDTAVIGQGSSVELAALGPGTVLCDNMSMVFMFLSIATSNLVATALARRDRNEVQHQISILLFVGLTFGVMLLLFSQLLSGWALTAFAGSKNAHIVPAATKYVQIRGLAWPAVLVGWVTQSASLGMKDSWGPLKALVVSSSLNIAGHIVLCTVMGYGIAGAAWSTMVSQVIAACMMINALNQKGYNGLAISIPSPTELLQIMGIAAPVMIQMYSMCVVWGEPLSQTAQSFMPEILYGINRSLLKARTLLKSLVIIGALTGLTVGSIGTSVPWLFPKLFTPDPAVIREMHNVLIPFFIALCITPSTHSLEGTLLAGRDLKFISLTMSGCFSLGALLLLFVSNRGYGLPGCWCALVVFQW
ncbi:Multi antimicrobial extrusion protein, partial [Dillenia turbinata]